MILSYGKLLAIQEKIDRLKALFDVLAEGQPEGFDEWSPEARDEAREIEKEIARLQEPLP